MRSPFGSVSSLLSSMTLFMFSTHTASTSPSKTIQRTSSSLPGGSASLFVRKILLSTPSCQSRVAGSMTPYISFTVCALGLSVKVLMVLPKAAGMERCSVVSTTLLPPPVGPTSMVVWRVRMIS